MWSQRRRGARRAGVGGGGGHVRLVRRFGGWVFGRGDILGIVVDYHEEVGGYHWETG